MEEAFVAFAREYGLPVTLLLGANLIMGRVVLVLWREMVRLWEARLADAVKEREKAEVREKYYRDRWERTLGTAEVATVTAKALSKRQSGSGGG